VAAQFLESGEDGEDLPLVLVLRQPDKTPAGTQLGCDGDVELDALDLAVVVQAGRLGRAISRRRVDLDVRQVAAMLAEELGYLFSALERPESPREC